MPKVTLNWSQSRLRMESGAWVANESWTVTGTDDKELAIESAVAHATPHWDNPNLLCAARDADQTGPLTYRVKAEFKFGDPGLCALSPIGENTKKRWEPVRVQVPIDIDVDGNPIVNSAGQLIDPPITETIPSIALVARCAQPYFSVATALNYIDAVSSDAFSVRGDGGVDPGQAYCDYIKPIEDYTISSPYVWVEYRIIFQPGSDPFQAMPMDAGRVGWYDASEYDEDDPTTDAQLGFFCTSDGKGNVGQNTPFDIRLDGTGMPIDPQWKVNGADGTAYTPIANPTPPPGLATQAAYSSKNVTTLLWKNKRAVAFSGMIPGL